MNGAPQELKVKINESRLLKFYPENSTENSAEKNLKKIRNLINFETFRSNKKKKYSNSKNFVSRTLSQISFPQIALKFATLYLFYPFFSSFFSTKFPLKNFIVCVIFSNQYPNYKAVELTV